MEHRDTFITPEKILATFLGQQVQRFITTYTNEGIGTSESVREGKNGDMVGIRAARGLSGYLRLFGLEYEESSRRLAM